MDDPLRVVLKPLDDEPLTNARLQEVSAVLDKAKQLAWKKKEKKSKKEKRDKDEKVERGDSKDEQEVKEEKKESGDTKEPESLVTSTDSAWGAFAWGFEGRARSQRREKRER